MVSATLKTWVFLKKKHCLFGSIANSEWGSEGMKGEHSKYGVSFNTQVIISSPQREIVVLRDKSPRESCFLRLRLPPC